MFEVSMQSTFAQRDYVIVYKFISDCLRHDKHIVLIVLAQIGDNPGTSVQPN